MKGTLKKKFFIYTGAKYTYIKLILFNFEIWLFFYKVPKVCDL